MPIDSKRKKVSSPKKPVDPHTQKTDLQNGLKTLHFLYRTGLLVFSVKYLVVPFMHIYERTVYSSVGQQVEPRIRNFDEKFLGPFMSWVFFGLHFLLRYLLLATYPVISVLIKYVLIPLKRSTIRGFNKLQAKTAELDPDTATKLETIAVQKNGKTVPSATVMAQRAKEDIQYKETTFQFTKIAFKIFYNRLQLAFVDAQFVWGYGPRDPETDSRLALERGMLIDQREYLLALRNYDERVEAAMKRRRMQAAAEAAIDDLDEDSTIGDHLDSPDSNQPQRGLENDLSNDSSNALPTSEKPETLTSGVVEVIENIASKVKSGLGIAENEVDTAERTTLAEQQEEDLDDLPSPPTPPLKPDTEHVTKVLSPDTAALDARVRKADHLSAVAITPYAAVAVARVQSSERQAVKKAFAKKKKQKKIAYQKTHFMDRLKSVLGFRERVDDQQREKADTSSTISMKDSIGDSITKTPAQSPVEVTEGRTYIAKDTTGKDDKSDKASTSASDKTDKVKEEKERNSKLPKGFNTGKIPDPSLTFFDRLLGREDESKAAEEITDTLLPEIKNPLATRKSSRMVKDDDDQPSMNNNDQSSDDEESIKRREEEAMRKRRMEYSSRQQDQENQNEDSEQANDGIKDALPDDAKQPKSSKPSHLDKEDIMSQYHNPFLGKKSQNSKTIDSYSVPTHVEEEGVSSNDITPNATHRSLGSTPASSTRSSARDLKGRTADVLSRKHADTSQLDREVQLTGNTEMPRTTSKPALHPFFLASGTDVQEADDHKYLQMVSELNPF